MWPRKKTKKYKVGDKYVKKQKLGWLRTCGYCDTILEEKQYIKVRYREVPEGARDLKIVEHYRYKFEIVCPRCGLKSKPLSIVVRIHERMV